MSSGHGRGRLSSRPFLTLIAAALCFLPAVPAAAQTYQLISIAYDGGSANGPSHFPALSESGQCVAYESDASNLVAGDTNGVTDIFVFDRQTRVTTRESVGSSGIQANGASHQPAVSGDCRLVVFQSDATNLVAGVSGTQIYIRDRRAGATFVVSVSTSGVPGNGSIGGTKSASISADGRVVSFVSDASNLVSGDTNGVPDIFTRDLTSGLTARESVGSNGGQLAAGGSNPFLTANGRYLAFASAGSVFVRDRSAGQTRVAYSGSGANISPSVSGDGRYVTFMNYVLQPFSYATYFYDLLGGETTLISQDQCCHNSSTIYAAPRVASDGRLFVQRSQTTGVFLGRGSDIRLYAADLTVIKDIGIRLCGAGLANCDTVDVDESPSLGPDAIAYTTIAAQASSDSNGTYDVYVASLDLTGPMSTPQNLSHSLTGSTLALTWTPPAIGVPTSYVIEAGTSPGSSDLGNVQTGSATTYVTRVPASSRFFVRVRAVNASGISNPSNEVLVSAVPGTPTNLSGVSNGSTVALTWNAPQSGGPVSNYVVKATYIVGFNRIQSTITTAATNLTINAVPNNGYSVTVSASNGSGSSAASNVALVGASGSCTALGPPSDLAAVVNGSVVTLTWTAGSGATSYLLQAGSGTGRNDLVNSDLASAATTLVSAGVPPGTYYVSLRSLSPCGTSAASNEVVVTVR